LKESVRQHAFQPSDFATRFVFGKWEGRSVDGLTPSLCVLYPFYMAVETLGEAMDASWRVTVRCAWGPRDGMKRVRECVYGGELDLQTLIWTRGRDFPLTMLESRLKCPRCGSRRVKVAFSVPPSTQQLRA
jgi:hypothetical protein